MIAYVSVSEVSMLIKFGILGAICPGMLYAFTSRWERVSYDQTVYEIYKDKIEYIAQSLLELPIDWSATAMQYNKTLRDRLY